MGLLGSAMGRGLAAAGGAAARLADKYIDEGLAQERAQFIADLQFKNTQRTEEWQQSDTVQGRRRENVTKDTLAASGARDAAELASLNNQPLTQARTAAKDAEADADTGRKIKRRQRELTELTPAEIAAQNQVTEGTTEPAVKREGLLAEARARGAAKYREPRQDSSAEIAKKVAAIEQVLGRKLSEDEKLAALGLVKGSQRDPELDTVTVEETAIGDDGTQRKTTRKEVRKPGQGGPAAPTDDPIKAAMDRAREQQRAPAPPKPAQPAAAPAPQRQRDAVELMSVRDLQRIAAIPGHVNQKKAQAELERRRQEQPSNGGSTAADMLNAAS